MLSICQFVHAHGAFAAAGAAAALACLAIMPLPASAIVSGLRILGLEEGLPRLPHLSRSMKSLDPTKAVTLAAHLQALAQGPSRPTI